MSTHVRRSALSVAAAVAVLGLVSGCGGGGSDAKTSEKDASSAKALSKAELEKLALEQGDVEGYTIEKASSADMAALQADTTKPDTCRPISDMVVNSAPGKPAATVLRDAMNKSGSDKPIADGDGDLEMKELEDFADAMENTMNVSVTKIGLSSYDGDGASSALDDLRSWLDSCKGGFTVGSEKQGITDLKAEAAALGADEAVTWTMTTEVEGKTTPSSKFAVYRDGNTVGYFMVLSFTQLQGGELQLPQELVKAQLAKLG